MTSSPKITTCDWLHLVPDNQMWHLAGDPCAPVAAAADAAVSCLCVHCGYGGSLSRLLSENADYVVDGVCARLRAMDSNPRWECEGSRA